MNRQVNQSSISLSRGWIRRFKETLRLAGPSSSLVSCAEERRGARRSDRGCRSSSCCSSAFVRDDIRDGDRNRLGLWGMTETLRRRESSGGLWKEEDGRGWWRAMGRSMRWRVVFAGLVLSAGRG